MPLKWDGLGPIAPRILVGISSVTGELDTVHITNSALDVSSPPPGIVDIADHVFSIAGAGFVFDPTIVDVDQYQNIGFWVWNATMTNPLASVTYAFWDQPGGSGPLLAVAIPVPVPVATPDLFYMSANLVFDKADLSQWHTFRSLSVGVQLTAAAPAQTIGIGYRGVNL